MSYIFSGNIFSSLGSTFEAQRRLSSAQAIPVLGVAVSVVKGVLSLVQIIAGIAGTILFGSLAFGALLTSNERMRSFSDCMVNYAGQSILHAGLGILSFIYSGVNIATLGLAAYRFEKLARV